MPVQLPIDAAYPNYRVGITLNDIPYIFDVHWNGRDNAWYFDVLDSTELPIRCGIKIVLGTSLGVRSTDPRYPSGMLVATDTSGEGRDATIDDLGSRVVVLHYTVEEFEALEAP
jgi:hypothetical protein